MRVVSVSRASRHRFSKPIEMSIRLIAGLGVDGDAHAGVTVQHRSRLAREAGQPNLRQVHLLHTEILSELHGKGFVIAAGEIGENVLTEGVDLLGLSQGTCLRLGDAAVIEITGLRNPCVQMNRFRPGLMAALLDRAPDGGLIRRAGVMGIVQVGGDVHPGDTIHVVPPRGPPRPLPPV